jgi:hypothetical protein
MDISNSKNKVRKRPPEKSLRFPVATHDKLLKLCEKLGRNQVEVFVEMVDYFYRTKKDPADINDEILKTALAKNHDTYIRFIRKQEDTLLIPVRENVDKLITNQREIVKYFNEQVLNANTAILKNQDEQLDQSEKTEEILQAIYGKLDNKEKLKTKFLHILNSYIRLRDEIGTFKNREKEELTESVRKQVTDL